jgi:transcriptional regulator with XRE-family HTH domain
MARQRLSGRATAAALKISPATFWRITSGSRPVTAKSLAAAAAYLRAGAEGPPPALVPTSTRPRQEDYRLSLDSAQRERLERLAQDLERSPSEVLQNLANVLLWPGAPSRVRDRFFYMAGKGWGSNRAPRRPPTSGS